MSEQMIPLSVPSIEGNEWKYVKECLDTGWVSSAGGYVTRFEEVVTRYTGASLGVAVVNGTAALHLALQVAGVEADDEVIVPAITFIAPVNAVDYLGAHPVFMDSDSYYNIDAEKTAEFIREKTESRAGKAYNRETGRRISAIVPVHVFGNAVDINEFYDLCKERDIRIIEDATESLGTYYTKGRFKGKYTGSVGDIGCLSFNGNKIITTGGGGMILTDNEEYADRCRYLATQAKDDQVRYVHGDIGYNYRLTNIQAAMGVAQMEMLDEFIGRKKKNFAIYREEIGKIDGLQLVEVPDYAEQNHWFYSLRVDKGVYGMDREELMEYLRSNDIQARPVWYPNHLQKMFRDCQSYRIERALELWSDTLNIPCSVNLDRESIMRVIEVLSNG
jgi:aminotransferase in exopolysaccharide biosynthesis